MFKRFAAALLSLAAVMLPGCDAIYLDRIKPGVSSAAEVRQLMGEPAAEHANADGSVTWEYNRQPQGVHTHMLTFGADKVLLRIEQALSDGNYARIVNGLGREQVRRIFGAPGSSVVYPLKREEVWDWRVEGTLSSDEWHFHVHFDVDSGLVVGTSKMIAQRG